MYEYETMQEASHVAHTYVFAVVCVGCSSILF